MVRRRVARSVRFVGVPLLVTGVTAGVAAAGPALAAQARNQEPSAFTPYSGQFNAAAVTTSGDAWAVGLDDGTLAQYWNGKAWTQVPSPDPVTVTNGDELTANQLQSVAATSASNAWAVGFTQTPNGSKTMILHWNGKAWTAAPSPNPYCSSCDSLYGVASNSTRNAWAVGTVNSGGLVVILRWNGTRWVNYQSANALL
jgi:hypothetical protein